MLGMLAVIVVVVGYGIDAHRHDRWPFWRAFPEYVHWCDRTWGRGMHVNEAPPSAWARVGRTGGGGIVFAPDSSCTDLTPTGLYVRHGSETWTYGLLGGP